MTELNINRKKFNKGDVVYFLVNDEKIPYKKNVWFGTVEENYTTEICIQMYDPRERRVVNGIPANKFKTPTEWKKLPKGWSYNTKLFELDFEEPNEEEKKEFRIDNPEDIKKVISNGLLIKVQEKDHCIFETEIDKEKGWRIVRKYYDNYKPPYVSRFYYDVYATYDEAKEKADEIKAELDRQANLTDYEWSVEQIDKMLYKAAKFNYITEEQAKEFRKRLLALDDVEEVCCRVCNRSVQWKYDHHKKWKTLK